MKRLLQLTLGILTSIGGFLDVGAIATSAQAGAEYRFKLLWAVALETLCVIFLVEMAGRLAAVSQHTIVDAMRAKLGFKFYIWPLAAELVVDFLTLAAEIGGVSVAPDVRRDGGARPGPAPVAPTGRAVDCMASRARHPPKRAVLDRLGGRAGGRHHGPGERGGGRDPDDGLGAVAAPPRHRTHPRLGAEKMSGAVTELNLEMLLGRRVLQTDGKSAGRIHEIQAEQRGDEWAITEYHIGPTALLSRLSAFHLAAPLFRLLGADKDAGRRVPWDKMDLSDPDRPTLFCDLDALPRLMSDPTPGASADPSLGGKGE